MTPTSLQVLQRLPIKSQVIFSKTWDIPTHALLDQNGIEELVSTGLVHLYDTSTDVYMYVIPDNILMDIVVSTEWTVYLAQLKVMDRL